MTSRAGGKVIKYFKISNFAKVKKSLRDKCSFGVVNLFKIQETMRNNTFDIIFCRNVMIYFDDNTKQNVIDKIFHLLNPGGHLFISHSETLHGIEHHLKLINPAIYQREN